LDNRKAQKKLVRKLDDIKVSGDSRSEEIKKLDEILKELKDKGK